MNDVPEEEAGAASPGAEAGMLSNLPRTRPQRASARRAAAREQNAAAAATPGAAGTERPAAQPKPRKRTKPMAATAKPARGRRSGPAVKASTAGKPRTKAATGSGTGAKATAAGSPKRATTGTRGAPTGPKAKRGGKAVPRATVRGAGAHGRTGAAPAEEPVPRQGFAAEEEPMTGPVQPPGGAELLASATEILGELAKSGLSTGERLVKDMLSRFSPS